MILTAGLWAAVTLAGLLCILLVARVKLYFHVLSCVCLKYDNRDFCRRRLKMRRTRGELGFNEEDLSLPVTVKWAFFFFSLQLVQKCACSAQDMEKYVSLHLSVNTLFAGNCCMLWWRLEESASMDSDIGFLLLKCTCVYHHFAYLTGQLLDLCKTCLTDKCY